LKRAQGDITAVSLQETTLGVLVAEGVNVLGRQSRLWSTEAKVWGIVRLHGTEVVTAVSQTIPSGHRAAPRCVYALHPHGALLVVTV